MTQLAHRKCRGIRCIPAVLALGLMALMLIPLLAPPAYATTANLNDAKAKYSVTDDRVITVTAGTSRVQHYIDEAASNATAQKKCIVYLPEGTYAVSSKLVVPANVVLVGETESKVFPSEAVDALVELNGSVYGGYFDGKKIAKTVLKFRENSFSNNNGRIDKSIVTNAYNYGIAGKGQGCQNFVVSGVKVTKSGKSGISVMDAAYVKTIENSQFCNNGANKEGAGINLSHADAGAIKNCNINYNADKAVSTNSDPVSGYKYDHPGCTITTITGCTMKGNGVNGVYIKPNCKLYHFTKNKMYGNNDCLSAVAKTPAGTVGKSIIKDVSGNTFKGSKNIQIKAAGKGAAIYMGSNNKVIYGKKGGIEAENRGKVIIRGSKNLIKYQKGAGLNVRGGGYVLLTGTGDVISDNKHSSVYCTTKGKVVIKKARIKGRIYCVTKGSVYLYSVKRSGKIATGSGGTVTKK
ncbi:MAG: right-handed parallel beta-helix repeat-containing protein [Coriobacteriia bacterium]|nr:right-handed parallel beta-helix repeat-containing protein [Coriobacteriia bacterium]